MTNNSKLPFELSVDALTSWLNSLSALPQIQAVHQLNLVLKQFKDEESRPTELLPLLISLTPLTLHLSNAIASAAVSEQKPIDKPRKAAKLSIQLLRQLSLLFCQLTERANLNELEQLSAMYHALQCIGYCIRRYNLFYETPSATLWKKSAELYNLAVEKNALLIHLPTKIAEFKQQPTIESVIKRNLLFSIMAPSLFTSNEISQIFQVATEFAEQLKISAAPDNLDFGFYWDLHDEIPPCPTRKSQKALPDGFMAIDAHSIGQALQQDSLTANLSIATQNKLALHLLDYQPIFDSIIPGLTLRSEFLFGFNDVSDFLQELNKLQKIKHFSGQNNSASKPKRNLALVPMEHERNAFETINQALNKTNAVSKSGNVLTITDNNYLVVEGHAFDCSTGDIAMFYRDQEPAMLGIIRQQSALSISNVIHILIEKITGFYNIYTFKTTVGNRAAIVLDEDSDNAQVFLPPGKYQVDSKIPLTIGESLYLTACLESNSFFARFKFCFDS